MITKRMALPGFFLSFFAGMTLVWGLDSDRVTHDLFTMEAGGRWSDQDSPVPVSSDDPVWGSRTAKATVVVFSELECPACAQVQRVLDRVRASYDKDTVRIVWKNFPQAQHQSARQAAVAAQTVRVLGGNEAFGRFVDLAFSGQPLSIENLEKWAQQVGVRMDHYRQAVERGTFAGKVDADASLARTLDIRTVPHVLVNGVPSAASPSFERLQGIINAQIRKADEMLSEGVKPTRLYVELSRQGRGAAMKKPL